MSKEKIVVFTPHPDDETLGMGGTIAKMSKAGHDVTVVTVSAHSPPLYSEEMRERTLQEAKNAHERLGVHESTYLGYAAVSLEATDSAELNRAVLAEVEKHGPTQVYIPFFDRHSDHRAVFESAVLATRPMGVGQDIRLVAAYETLSATNMNVSGIEPAFSPNYYVDITEEIDTKLEAMAEYESQLQPFPEPRSLEALRGLSLFRGASSGVGFAEAFQVIRMNDAVTIPRNR
ncbi:MAG TPA: PIG-L deacetylase family protein [Candidatus Saccharimonadales bacterium]|nr:PIG-L deacetylase family protein [Candidatus Saccharimonadales bacterium]